MPAIDLTPITTTRQLADRMIAAFNAGDIAAMTQAFAPGYAYDEVTTGRVCIGVEAFSAAMQDWRAAFPDMVGTVTAHASSGGLAVTEVTWTGTHLGTLATPQGEIAATGRRITTRSCVVDVVDEDFALRSSRHYVDVVGMMTQLLGPEPALPGQAPAAD